MGIPEHLVIMARRTTPKVAAKFIVPRSTPVLAFGDARSAEVATLGINPSASEFLKDGRLLRGSERRLATLQSLRARSTSPLTKKQVQALVEGCASYFHRKPYTRWFNPLNEILRKALGVSYCDGSACHLDLVQWATDPAWRRLDDQIKRSLLQEGLPYLKKLLALENIRLVILLGRQVITQVQEVGLARLQLSRKITSGDRSYSLYSGEGEGVRFLGWTVNVQSNPGITQHFKSQLADWLRKQERNTNKNPRPRVTTHQAVNAGNLIGSEGHILSGTSVSGKSELCRLLNRWLRSSAAPTIGSIGTFGRKPCIFISLQQDVTAVLNSDTKRAAVKEFLKECRANGPDALWSVIPNRFGRLNKLTFRADRAETPGWYCYLRGPLPIQRRI